MSFDGPCNFFLVSAAHRPSVGSECEDTLKFSMIQLEKEKQEYKTKAIEFETQLIQLTKEKAALEMEFEKAKSSVSREKGTMEELQQNLEKVSFYGHFMSLCYSILKF